MLTIAIVPLIERAKTAAFTTLVDFILLISSGNQRVAQPASHQPRNWVVTCFPKTGVLTVAQNFPARVTTSALLEGPRRKRLLLTGRLVQQIYRLRAGGPLLVPMPIVRLHTGRMEPCRRSMALWRFQLFALHAQRPRRRLTAPQKLFWVLLRRAWADWKQPLLLVTPRTVVSWHRAGFG